MDIKIESSFLDDDINININNNNCSNEKEYIKNVIKKGIDTCETKKNLIEQLLDNIEVFEPVGIDYNISQSLLNLKDMFETSIPALLLGDYDKLNLIDDEYINVYKVSRKKLIKNFTRI